MEFALELLVLMELAYSVYMGLSGCYGYITTLLHIMNGRSHIVYTLDTHSCNLPLTVWVIYPIQLPTHHISQCGNPSLSATGRRRVASHAHWSADSASPLPSKASYWPMASPVTARRFGDAKKPLYACITGNTRLLLLHDSCICRIQCIYYSEYFVYSGLWLLSFK